MEEHKFLDFLKRHWSKFLLCILAIACIFAWGERLFSKKKNRSQQDFLIANQIFERFQKGEPLALESIHTTESILKRHPELQPKFGPMLAMTYLAQRNPAKAAPYAKESLKHLPSGLPPFYKSYGETSLLIAEKNYQEAYGQAKLLDDQLKNTENASSTLYAMNLLRLVSLESELGIEGPAWEELRIHPAYLSITSLFHEGSLTLEDWHLLRLNN